MITALRKINTTRLGRWLAAALVVIALLGVCAECEGGMYQGGSDSEPHWRK